MAGSGWSRSVTVAILAGATAAAAQAGLGYGLDIVSWAPGAAGVTTSGAWASNLAWTTLIGATSVVIGGVAGDRASAGVQSGPTLRGIRRVVCSLAAVIGGAAIIPLTVVPAQAARLSANFAPHILVGVYAVIGLAAGLVVALLATAARAIAANVFATLGWLWTLAVIVLVHRSVTGQPLAYIPLAVWKFTENGPTLGPFYVPGAMLMFGSALLIGGLAALPSAGRGAARLGIVVSGAIGPLLITLAYQLAAPDAASTPFEELSAYRLSAFIAVAGLVGSVLVAAVGGVPKPRGRGPHAGIDFLQ
jgi:hypothetical protein